jgi:hypothetical protein
MVCWKRCGWLVLVGMGVAGGMVLSGVLPHSPLYAVATDRMDTFGMATGPLEAEVEAVYFLDFLTGDLRAVVLGKQPGTWTGFFQANVAADLGVDPQKNPKYLMVTGMNNLRRSGGTRQMPSTAMCYVAEITSGQVVAYAVPWTPSLYAAGQVQSGALIPVGITRFRSTLGAGPGPGPGRGEALPGGPRKRP